MRTLVFLLLTATASAQLPEGPGLASKYPADRGIEKHPSVLRVESFDDSLQAVFKRFDEAKNKPGMRLDPGISGTALGITHTGGQGTGSHLYTRLLPGHELLFCRMYVKFDSDCAPIHHFGTHLGGFHPPTPWPQGGAGIRPDGAKRFTSGVEPGGKNWNWDFYTYWQGMRRHGGGKYWGTPFLTRTPKPPVAKDTWICVEMMMKMNTPGKSNGEQAFWIDGKLVRHGGQVVSHAGPGFPKGKWTGGWWNPDADAKTAFEGFSWRNHDKLAVNYLWIYLYITKAAPGHVSRVWFDQVVLAKEYIGPMTR